MQPDPSDKTVPTLSSSLPSEGASAVPINVKLGFSFSEAMSESSLELTSNPAITLGTATWNTDGTSVAFANENLATSTAYSLTLKAKDISGNALGETTLTFTTSDSADTTAPTPPTGLVATPANGQVTLIWGANPEADVVGYTLYVGTAQDKLESKGFVTTNSTTITNLTNDTKYFFALDAVDAANNHSGQTTPVSATPSATITDTTAPTLQSSDPADNADNVNPLNLKIKLVFSEPMDESSLNLTFEIAEPKLVPAVTTPFEVVWSEADTVATLTPNEPLFEGNTFVLTLSAKDKAGNALSGNKDVSFTTGFEVPTLVSSDPADGATNVATQSASEPFILITLKFSEAINAATFEFDESIFPVSCEGASFLPDNVTVILACYVADGNTYALSYSGQDFDGHTFTGSISFSTIPDTVPPSVNSTFPDDLTVNVPLIPIIFIHFNDEMDEASTLAAISSSASLGCTWELNRAKDILSCNPANLQSNTTYIITVAATATDTSGHNLIGAGSCRSTPPCSYSFTFTTIKLPGELRVNITGAVEDKAKVRVSGPNGYSSGNFSSSMTLTDLEPGTYTITSEGFITGQFGKPTCKTYTPTPDTQQETVTGGQTTTVSVMYTSGPCE
jgi:methionine-rich copper-binding protein CopC